MWVFSTLREALSSVGARHRVFGRIHFTTEEQEALDGDDYSKHTNKGQPALAHCYGAR